MISLQETIHVDRPVDECFAYVANFTTTAEWDATAFEAEKCTPGPIKTGTQFSVRCSLPIGSVTIEYTVSEFRPPEVVALDARCWLFTGVDRIAFRRDKTGTAIDYRADFELKSPFRHLAGLLRPGMERMGRLAVEGLRQALEDDFEAPSTSSGAATADRLVWPGLALFSKLGYRRGRKHFNPISASLENRRMVITGASSGLGLAAARSLAERGADLVLVMRNEDKAQRVVQDLQQSTGNPGIRYELADLASMADVDALAQRLLREGRSIDVLVNNAGALFNEWGETDEGLERSFALLLLSPYRLTLALKPLLEAAQGRVVNVLSGGMYTQPLRVDRLQARPENYNGAVAYARCKRALMVVTEEWAQAWGPAGVTVNAMHPGWADTPGVETALPGFHRLTRRILRTPEEGADTIVWLAAATEAAEATGRLFLDREPRTTHLLRRTEASDNDAERQRLMAFMADFETAAETGAAA